MGLQTHFREFNNTIYLKKTDSRLNEARTKRDSINKAIKSAFREKEWGEVTTFLQGSYATDVAIVPLDGDYDIDVAISIPSDSPPESPIDPKRVVKSILDDRGLTGASIKRPCVTAQYLQNGEPKFHIDYPVYKLVGDQYYLAWGKPTSEAKDKKWSPGDPKGLVDWINHSDLDDDERRQYKCLVRYLKRWRDLRYSSDSVKPYSVGLTIMIRSCYSPSFSDDGEANDLSALINTVSNMIESCYFRALGDDKYDLVVDLPASPYIDVFKDHGSGVGTKLFNRLGQLKKRLLAANDKSTVKAACKILAEDLVFGDDFPIPEDNGGSNKSHKSVKVTAGAVGSPQGA